MRRGAGGGGVRGACLLWVKCDICIMELLSSMCVTLL